MKIKSGFLFKIILAMAKQITLKSKTQAYK